MPWIERVDVGHRCILPTVEVGYDSSWACGDCKLVWSWDECDPTAEICKKYHKLQGHWTLTGDTFTLN